MVCEIPNFELVCLSAASDDVRAPALWWLLFGEEQANTVPGLLVGSAGKRFHSSNAGRLFE